MANYILGHNILELYNVFIQIRLTTSKTKRDAKLVYELPHELPNDIGLRILGNKETLGQSQTWVQIQPCAQFPPQKPYFGNNSQKIRKSRYQTLIALSNLTESPHSAPNTPFRIVEAKEAKIIGCHVPKAPVPKRLARLP